MKAAGLLTLCPLLAKSGHKGFRNGPESAAALIDV